jgi:hypothetical protein
VTFVELSESEARELVRTLQNKRCAGSDDLELMTWLSNRFRIGQKKSRPMYDDFYRGFQHGADSVLQVIDGKATEAIAPGGGSAIYRAAYELGQQCFSAEYARSLERHKPRGCLPLLCLGFAVAILVSRFLVGI